jgi:hypothetical protein
MAAFAKLRCCVKLKSNVGNGAEAVAEIHLRFTVGDA